MADSTETIWFKFRFQFEDQSTDAFEISLNENTLFLNEISEPNPPQWTQLENKKCQNCPLNVKTHPHCPIAKNMSALLVRYVNHKSFPIVTAEVETKQRTYKRTLPLQEVMHSAFGLIMATSGCPHMDFLRPMARFHLPFATYEETVIRSTSFYLLKQYFISKRGGVPDFELAKIESVYEQVTLVNQGFVNRIRSIIKGDAAPNSVVILDGYGQLLAMHVAQKLDHFESWFLPPNS